MLNHHNQEDKIPRRVVILGANGFIGGAIHKHLKVLGIQVLALGRMDFDLLSEGAGRQLADILACGDILVFAAAKAPCKNIEMLLENIQMAKAVVEAMQVKVVEQLIYISSDAVYADTEELITESSGVGPESIHGIMHLTREVVLKQACNSPLVIVRPTLVYGVDDPHNGYGPNRFRRLAGSKEDILLFGNGEERRDHVDVEDIAELVAKIIFRKSYGVINAVSGDIATFRELAELIAADFDHSTAVINSVRSGPMPHNGYRAFDDIAISNAFPGFKFKSWRQGVSRVNQVYKEQLNK